MTFPDFDQASVLAGLPPAERTEWTTDELREDFEVLSFNAPFVIVRRRRDGREGSLMFDHSPRRYYAWVEDD